MRISDWSSDVCSSDLPSHVAFDTSGVLFVGSGVLVAWASLSQAEQPGQNGRHALVGVRRRGVLRDGSGGGVRVGHRIGMSRPPQHRDRSEEHTSELQSLMRISYAVFCLKKKKKKN